MKSNDLKTKSTLTKKHIWRRRLTWVICIFTFIILFFNSNFLFKKSDKTIVNDFKKVDIEAIISNVLVQGHHLHVVQVGNDTLPTLVFVHGSPGDWSDYSFYLQDSLLRLKFRIIAIDRPGFGGSEAGKALHLQPQAAIIGTFLQQIKNNKPLYLIGHSYGGPLVALLAADNPTLISKIIIIAGALDPTLEAKEKWRTFFIHRPMRYLLPGAGQPSNEELWYLKKDLLGLAKKLPLIICPIQVLHATNDMLVDYRNTTYIKERCTSSPHVDIMTFNSGNHFLPFNRQQEIMKLLMKLPTVR